MNQNNPPNILILTLSGIGNFLMHTPLISAIKDQLPASTITTWVAPRGTKILAEHNPSVDQVIEMPIKTTLAGHLKNIQRLRQQSFTHALMLSPGQQIKGALYMFMTGIPQRLAHQYPFHGNSQNNLFLTQSLPEQSDLHDIEQNLNLLPLLDLKIPPTPHIYHLPITPHYNNQAQQYLKKLSIPKDKTIIGLHPGSAPDFTWKRWPEANFIELSQRLIAKHNAHIFLFGGPDEQPIKQAIHQALPNQSSIIDSDLLTTAAIMQSCQLFISNDSGLMHVAAATGVATLGLFGPTDEAHTGPRGPKSHTLRAPGTKPVYDTDTNFDLGPHTHPTLQHLSVDAVLSTAINVIHP